LRAATSLAWFFTLLEEAGHLDERFHYIENFFLGAVKWVF
jgi:hypothetical protein